MYVYLKSEPNLWTVGHHDPVDSAWVAESDHPTAEDAAKRVHYLNGGGMTEERHDYNNQKADIAFNAALRKAYDESRACRGDCYLVWHRSGEYKVTPEAEFFTHLKADWMPVVKVMSAS